MHKKSSIGEWIKWLSFWVIIFSLLLVAGGWALGVLKKGSAKRSAELEANPVTYIDRHCAFPSLSCIRYRQHNDIMDQRNDCVEAHELWAIKGCAKAFQQWQAEYIKFKKGASNVQ